MLRFGAISWPSGKTVTLKLTLSNQEQSFLAKHKGRKLKSKINLTFTPKKGGRLKSSVTVLIG
jgi:hypothetical protein